MIITVVLKRFTFDRLNVEHSHVSFKQRNVVTISIKITIYIFLVCYGHTSIFLLSRLKAYYAVVDSIVPPLDLKESDSVHDYMIIRMY